MITPRRSFVLLAASLVLVGPLLSGCSLLHLPGSADKGGGISIPGVGSVGSGKLPSDFPKDIPVIKGEVVTGASLGSGAKKVWNISVKVSSLDAFDTIDSELTGAGFTAQDGGTSKSDKIDTGVYTKDDYQVAVIVTEGDDKAFVANYTITKGASTN